MSAPRSGSNGTEEGGAPELRKKASGLASLTRTLHASRLTDARYSPTRNLYCAAFTGTTESLP